MNYEKLLQIITESKKITTKKNIPRDNYSDWLKKSIDSPLIKVITGFRRVGKSFLLKQLSLFLEEKKGVPPENIFFVNFEHDLLANKNQVKDLRDLFELFLKNSQTEKKIYLFLDEVQNINSWEKFVRTLYESKKDNYNIFITGSNSSLLSSEYSSALSGRTIELNVNPLNFKEYLKFFGIDAEELSPFKKIDKKTFLQQKLGNFFENGGLPETVNENPIFIKNYLNSVINKILFDDIIKRFKVDKPEILESLFYFIATNVTCPLNFNNIAKEINNPQKQITTPTLASYAKMYEAAFAIDKIAKLEWKTKKIFKKQFKYYIVDNGLLNHFHVSNLTVTEKLLENLVLNALKGNYSKIFYGRDETGKEIDFVIPYQNQSGFIKIQVTIKLNPINQKRELGNFVLADKYLGNGPNYLIVMEGETEDLKVDNTRIHKINLLDFLLEGLEI